MTATASGATSGSASPSPRAPSLPRSPYAGLTPTPQLNADIADELLAQAAKFALRAPGSGPTQNR